MTSTPTEVDSPPCPKNDAPSPFSVGSDFHSLVDEDGSFATSESSGENFHVSGDLDDIDQLQSSDSWRREKKGETRNFTPSRELNLLSSLELEADIMVAESMKITSTKEKFNQWTPSGKSGEKEERIKALVVKLEEMHKKYSSLEEEKHSLLVKLEEESGYLKKVSTEAENYKRKVERMKEDLSNNRKQKMRLEGELSLLKSELAALKEQSLELMTENEELKRKEDENRKLEKDLRKSQEKNKVLVSKLDETEQKLKEVKMQLQERFLEASQLNEKNSDLGKKREALEEEKRILMAEKVKIEEEKAEAEEKAKFYVETLTAQFGVLKEEKARLEELLKAEKEHIMKKSSKDVNEIKIDLAGTREMAGNLEQQNRKLLAERETLVTEIESLKGTCQELEAQCQQWEIQCREVTNKLQNKKTRVAELQRSN